MSPFFNFMSYTKPYFEALPPSASECFKFIVLLIEERVVEETRRLRVLATD
jgi:hypothetical protein